jgi:D-inositol-3-phosphate glycosyltransferase
VSSPVRRVGLLSVHTSPLEQPGAGDSGGMNVAILQLSRWLGEAGVEVEVFTRAAGGDLPSTVSLADGVRVHHLAAGPPGLAKAELASHLCAFYLAFSAHPAARNLDVVHGHYWMSGWVARQAARRRGLPAVHSFHTLAPVKNASLAAGEEPEPPLRTAAEDRIVTDVDAVIAPTPHEAGILRDLYAAPASAVHTVAPGVDLEVFRPDADREETRRVLGGGPLVLFAGRLQPLKAPDLAIRALAALDRGLPDGPPPRLVIVGGPSGRRDSPASPTALRRLAADLGVEERVAFLEPRPQTELARLYRAADAVIVPSRSESFGLVALEAQACGTPVVAADAGGLRHALGPGAGTLVAGWEPDAYAEALTPYLTDPGIRERTGRAGQRWSAEFTWQRTVEGTLAVYRAVLDRRAAAPMRLAREGRGA